jgi:hypothetical protein
MPSPTLGPTRSLSLIAALTLAANGPVAAERPAMTLDEVARGYVELALAIGEHDPNYDDA